MESHSSEELMECCMKQISDEFFEVEANICPNCRLAQLIQVEMNQRHGQQLINQMMAGFHGTIISLL